MTNRVVEVCVCGHTQHLHAPGHPTYYSGVPEHMQQDIQPGRGRCNIEKCSCEHFAWHHDQKPGKIRTVDDEDLTPAAIAIQELRDERLAIIYAADEDRKEAS